MNPGGSADRAQIRVGDKLISVRITNLKSNFRDICRVTIKKPAISVEDFLMKYITKMAVFLFQVDLSKQNCVNTKGKLKVEYKHK